MRRGDGRGRRRRRRRGVGEVEAAAEMQEGVVKLGFSAGVEKLIGEGGTLRANRHQRIRGQKGLHHLKKCFRDDFPIRDGWQKHKRQARKIDM